MSSVIKNSMRLLMACVVSVQGLAAEDKAKINSQTMATSPVAAAQPAKADDQAIQTCVKLHQKFAQPLQELWKKRGPDLRAENTDGYALIEDMTADSCKEPENRKELIELLARVLNTHSGKIGIILPLANHNYLRSRQHADDF